jgi:hypothetical protein
LIGIHFQLLLLKRSEDKYKGTTDGVNLVEVESLPESLWGMGVGDTELYYYSSQFLDYSNVLFAFQIVRELSVLAQIPIVHSDDFNPIMIGEIVWLKFLLSPMMQDGESFDHTIVRAVMLYSLLSGTQRQHTKNLRIIKSTFVIRHTFRCLKTDLIA